MMALLLAAALVQGAEPEIFAETEGWSIARHDGGCLMTQEYDGAGHTIITFAVSPADTSTPLTILVGNSGWSLPEADDEGYRIELSGSEVVWNDLAVRTFTTDGDGEGGRDGVISIGFAADAIASLMDDIAGASELHLSRQGVTVDRLALSGTEAAVGRLGECVRTLP